MTCRDVMTSNPSCCVPSDSVAMAAQIMKREDVGPVLIVSDYNSRNLIGIVTDRDLAVKVIAEGRDPHNTRIDEVMSINPVSCRENEDTSKALRLMAEHQVRRVPIVDARNRLVGIIAQADLALHEDEEDVGEMVEEISQPYGSGSWTTRSREFYDDRYPESSGGGQSGTESEPSSVASSLAIGAICLGVGAGLMYMFDPNRGRTRRAIARDKAASWYNASGAAVSRTTQDLRNRAAGVASSTKSMLKSEPVSDEKLAARIRSKMGRCVSHPHAVHVESNGGHVRLSGSILAHEARKLLQTVKGLPGVLSVENHLDLHDLGVENPNLQGGNGSGAGPSDWSPTARVMASALGSGLLLYGIKSHSRIGKATSALGLGLLTRGITNREMPDVKGLSTLRQLVHI